MSKFAVELRKVSEVDEHPNADRLSVSRLEGLMWQFCTKKGALNVGDEVVYFPIDSCLPDDLSEFIGVKAYLSGKDQNRVKTAVLRGKASQGLAIRSSLIREYMESKGLSWPQEDLTTALGVTKYDPPGIDCKGATLRVLPKGLSAYDIENAENYPDILSQIGEHDVVITEKVEGSNFSVTVDEDGEVFVNQRNYTIDSPDRKHTFWVVAEKNGYIEAAKSLSLKHGPVTLYGEIVGPGIQKNIYKMDKKEVMFFDLLLHRDNRYMDSKDFVSDIPELGLKTVPVLWTGSLSEWLDGKGVSEASDGKSVINAKTMREGIVIKPCREIVCTDSAGEQMRGIIKQRSPVYLSKQKD